MQICVVVFLLYLKQKLKWVFHPSIFVCLTKTIKQFYEAIFQAGNIKHKTIYLKFSNVFILTHLGEKKKERNNDKCIIKSCETESKIMEMKDYWHEQKLAKFYFLDYL